MKSPLHHSPSTIPPPPPQECFETNNFQTDPNVIKITKDDSSSNWFIFKLSFFLTSICLVWQLSGFVLPADPAQHPAHLLLPGLRPLIRFSFGSEFGFFCSSVCNLQHPNHPSEDVPHHQPPPICLWAPPRQYSQIQYVKANIFLLVLEIQFQVCKHIDVHLLGYKVLPYQFRGCALKICISKLRMRIVSNQYPPV